MSAISLGAEADDETPLQSSIHPFSFQLALLGVCFSQFNICLAVLFGGLRKSKPIYTKYLWVWNMYGLSPVTNLRWWWCLTFIISVVFSLYVRLTEGLNSLDTGQCRPPSYRHTKTALTLLLKQWHFCSLFFNVDKLLLIQHNTQIIMVFNVECLLGMCSFIIGNPRSVGRTPPDKRSAADCEFPTMVLFICDFLNHRLHFFIPHIMDSLSSEKLYRIRGNSVVTSKADYVRTTLLTLPLDNTITNWFRISL